MQVSLWVFFGGGRKWASRKDEGTDRNICRAGCGRPGQRDYGWKGPAFNCCFGTVACLVEHKRPVRHASVAWTCEYLPDQWNAPLSPQPPLPSMIPSPDPHIYCTFSSFCFGLTHLGVIRIYTDMHLCELGTQACWELRPPLALSSSTGFYPSSTVWMM